MARFELTPPAQPKQECVHAKLGEEQKSEHWEYEIELQTRRRRRKTITARIVIASTPFHCASTAEMSTLKEEKHRSRRQVPLWLKKACTMDNDQQFEPTRTIAVRRKIATKRRGNTTTPTHLKAASGASSFRVDDFVAVQYTLYFISGL